MWRFATALTAAASLAGGTGAAAQESWHPSRYGADDRIGAANNLSQAAVRDAARLVKTGKTYSLAIPTGPDTPFSGDRAYHVEVVELPNGNRAPSKNKFTTMDDKVILSMGMGTQIDGLGHAGIDHHYYNGLSSDQVMTPTGLRTLDIASLPPIVGRGVLIDMARYFRKPRMEAGQPIRRADIEGAAKAQGIRIQKGDVVLVHTGWMSMADTDKKKYVAQQPGLAADAAQWLADQGIVAVGSDTNALEVMPFEDEGAFYPVHQVLLARAGVYILENVNTRMLAQDKANEFLFVLGPARLVGTVQGVVNPIAIR